VEIREARSRLGRRELLDGDAELARDGCGRGHTSSEEDESAVMEERSPRRRRELVPERVGALQQGYVGWALEVCLTDQAALTVRATAIVGGPEAVETDDAGAALGEVRRAAEPIPPSPSTMTSASHGVPSAGILWRFLSGPGRYLRHLVAEPE
jgi:hypothetical protein